MKTAYSWRHRIGAAEHVAAFAVALIVGAIVVRYTGDTDVLPAIGSGLGGGILAYLAVRLHHRP